MAKRTTKRKKKSSRKLSSLTVQNPNAAGIDIGSKEQWVAVRPDLHENPIRRFGSFTRDLNELADWLIDCNVNTVAMESTGVYWIPLFQVLEERGFEVLLVNAYNVKNVSGRKDDESDCEWIRKLHSYGLLQGSFQPEDKIRCLRTYLRDRDTLSSCCASHIQRMQKALTQMNLQLHHVISDITGKTGMNIIRAIVDGERDPEVLAAFRDKRIKASKKVIIKSLEGNYLQEQLSSLKRYLHLYDFYQNQIEDIDREIEQLLKTFPSVDDFTNLKDLAKPAKHPKKKAVNAPKFDVEKYIVQITGVDLFAVNGFNTNNLLGIIAETGLDMEKWKTEKHFTSWLRLSPNNKISGGKIISHHTQKTRNRANKLFRLAAQSLANSKCALGAFYRRLKYRIGAPKAIVATARKLAGIYYQMLRFKTEYRDIGAELYEIKYRQKRIKNLNKNAQALGFKLVEA
jgi:transposase